MSSTIIKSVMLVVAAVIASGDSVVSAQETGRVAILDVAKVFKENTSFGDGISKIKKEDDRLKREFATEQDRIKGEALALRGMPAGPERNQQEADIEQQLTRLRTKARQSQSELLNREARVYYDTYQQMQAVVEGMAKEYGLALVLRFDSEEIDPKNQEGLRSGLNRTVVFHRRLDLTKLVSDALNARMAEAAPATIR